LTEMLCQQMMQPMRQTYSDGDALLWSLDIAKGLAAIHESDPMVIHRDVKPDNIMFRKDKGQGRLVAALADFGLHVVSALLHHVGAQHAVLHCMHACVVVLHALHMLLWRARGERCHWP
jgi:tRNA A-37 threonylcarbamoyl transferase component Bud32